MPHLLIVFSAPERAEALAALCDDAGHTYDFATETEAAAKARRGGYALALVVSNAPLPLTRELRRAAAHLPLIALLDERREEKLAELREAGIARFVFLPCAPRSVQTALSDLLAPAPGR